MAKTKVFEISKHDTIRRFISQLSPDDHTASHILREDGTWEIWNGRRWFKTDECEIVTDVNQLYSQEL
jgi:hypothetical protein